MTAEPTAKKLPAHLDPEKQFKPGQSGNPAGRPKGTRNQFGEAFLKDFLADWEVNGAKAIADARTESAVQYVKVAASILPKEMNIKVSEFDDLTDEQIERRIATLLAEYQSGAGAAAGASEPPSPEGQAPGVPTVQ